MFITNENLTPDLIEWKKRIEDDLIQSLTVEKFIEYKERLLDENAEAFMN